MSLFSGVEPKNKIKVLDGVTFSVEKGEIVGIIGKNASGKSTLLRIIAGIYTKNSGKIRTRGKIISILNLGAGFKPNLTMRENIYLCCALFGLTQKEIKEIFNSIVRFSQLEKFVETKVYQFSSGMVQRLAFSIAVYSNPDILLLDEVFEVGDENFRKKGAQKIKELVKDKATVLFISHDLGLIRTYCNRTIWLEHGKVFKEGDPDEITREYSRSQ
jgi:ABC-type polysaccharide/polyol phosphate transport system ATPase subunit